MDREWMYDMLDSSRRLKQRFIDGVHEFVSKAMEQTSYTQDGGIRCPCVRCRSQNILIPSHVRAHLLRYGFQANYYTWIYHGEDWPTEENLSSASTSHDQMNYPGQFGSVTEMVYDAYMPDNFDNERVPGGQSPNAKTQKFYDMLASVNQPIYDGATESQLSIAIRLLAGRTKWHLTEKCLDHFIQLLVDVAPRGASIPKNYYEAKKIVSNLGLKSVIDCCKGGCMLYYKDDIYLTECKFCGPPRYLPRKGHDKNIKRLEKSKNMAGSSLAAPPQPKPVVVRVKRKPSQSPLDAFWLEISERPLKRSLLDFGNLSISDSAQKVDFHNKKVFVQHVETISNSGVTLDIVQSFVGPGSSCASISKPKVEERRNFFKRSKKQDQLLVKAKQEKESLAKDARFEQIWKSRKGKCTGTAHDKALQEICNFYDVVRIDNEEENKEVQRLEISLEDQKLLSSYLPLLREFIPNAAEEVEADLIAHLVGHSKEENFVYDLYTVTDEMDINTDDALASYPLVQVEEEEDYYDGPDDSDYESDDSNAENNPLNDYPDEISEEDEEEVEDFESESEGENGDASNESSNEDTEHHGFSKDDTDPYDEDFDEDEGVSKYDEYVDDEDWRWSYR